MNGDDSWPGWVVEPLTRAGVSIAAAWGFAEATLWFVVPDVVVGAVALLAPPRWWRAATAAVVASLLGGLVLFAVASAAGEGTREVVAAVPGISGEMVADVGEQLDAHGGSALVRAPLSGVPYKVYVVEMADRSWNVLSFSGWSLPSRMLRIVPVAAAAALVGSRLQGFIRRHLGLVVGAYTVGWLVLYAFYFRAVGL
jgi:membrane protein YqaA with SNARE-associated domain